MASRSRWWEVRHPPAVRGQALRAAALVLLVVLAPIGGLGDRVRAEQPTVEVAAGNYPRSDVQPNGVLERVHATGVTGDNVTVGILDVSGFDTNTAGLAGQVVAARTFGPGSGVPYLGRNAHGTATASIVASIAPDAEFYLASFSTPRGYRAAFDWLLASEVDVVVAPVSFYGQPRTAAANLSAPIERARRSGTTVVVPAGNLARSHWRGPYTPDARGRLRFGGDVRNRLRGNGSRVTLWLSWPRSADARFTLELYRRGVDEPVATSENYTTDAARNERLSAAIDPDGTYYFVVRGPPIMTTPVVTVESPTHRFEYATRQGSITQPALSEAAITVGAYEVGRGAVAPYSAAGPVAGRTGVDVVGPTNLVAPGYPRGFEGTSSAAAYTGGLAALVHDVDPAARPGHVELLLERTARDVGEPGPDPVAGYGVVELGPLLRLARNESSTARPVASSN